MVGRPRAVGYVRVSTERQAERGTSLAEQERALRSWARSHGYRLVAVHRDEGVSGTCDAVDRRGLTAALEALRSGEAEALVVLTLDRLARSLTVQEAALGHAWKAGGRVFTTDAGEVQQDDPDDPMRTALRQMMGVFAQLERGMVTARLRRGKAAKRAQGGYVGGRVSYGKKPAGDGALATDERETQLVQHVCRQRAAGLSYRAICAELEEQGFSTRAGGPWQPAVVRRIALRNGCA
jgi:DNA invertase Pin-like site-specific DNA recombinase